MNPNRKTVIAALMFAVACAIIVPLGHAGSNQDKEEKRRQKQAEKQKKQEQNAIRQPKQRETPRLGGSNNTNDLMRQLQQNQRRQEDKQQGKAERARREAEQQQREAGRRQAEAERQRREQQQQLEEKQRRQEEKQRAKAERQRLEAEQQQRAAEQRQAEAERQRREQQQQLEEKQRRQEEKQQAKAERKRSKKEKEQASGADESQRQPDTATSPPPSTTQPASPAGPGGLKSSLGPDSSQGTMRIQPAPTSGNTAQTLTPAPSTRTASPGAAPATSLAPVGAVGAMPGASRVAPSAQGATSQASQPAGGLYTPIPSVPDPVNPLETSVQACEPQIQAVVQAYSNTPQQLYPGVTGVTRERLVSDMMSYKPSRPDLGQISSAVMQQESKVSSAGDAGYREQQRRPLTYLKLKQCVYTKYVGLWDKVAADKAALRPQMISACDENYRRKEADLKSRNTNPDAAARELGQYMRDLFGKPPFEPLGLCADHPRQQEMVTRANLMIKHGVVGQNAQLASPEPERPPQVAPPRHIDNSRGPFAGTGIAPFPNPAGEERVRQEQQRLEEERRRQAAEQAARQRQQPQPTPPASQPRPPSSGGGQPAPRPVAPADRYGSLVIDYNQGQFYGWAVGYASQQEADAMAQNECARKSTSCTIVMRFRNACAAYAADQNSGSTAYGWAYGPSLAQAQSDALNYCTQRGGSGAQCIARVWGCTN